MEIMRQGIITQYLIHCYHIVLCKIMPIMISDEKAIRRYYKKRAGYELNLDSPETFSEKQQWYKLNDKNHLMEQCADKINVREYIKSCEYEELLNECYAVYNDVNDINIDDLPERFVLKAAHASGWNLIVKDKNAVNWKAQKRFMKLWLKQDISWSGREWVYKNLGKRIVAEKYLEDDSGSLCDYKFYCFNGKPSFLQLEVGRFAEHVTRNFYDMDWNLMPFGKELPHNPDIVVNPPSKFDEMKKIACDLSNPFSYVRVDLYQVHNKVFFGELTFFPAGGAPDFIPQKYDKIVGDMWDIGKNEKEDNSD